jgi:hypothetical protein
MPMKAVGGVELCRRLSFDPIGLGPKNDLCFACGLVDVSSVEEEDPVPSLLDVDSPAKVREAALRVPPVWTCRYVYEGPRETLWGSDMDSVVIAVGGNATAP